jgi:hypothetical protein
VREANGPWVMGAWAGGSRSALPCRSVGM